MNFADLLSACPHAPDYTWDWPALEDSPLGPLLSRLSETPQDPVWHGEGDAGRHTRMVCEALAAGDAYRALPGHVQQELALAALLHDVGKTAVTRVEDGRITSPNHSSLGARMVRELLWKEVDLCGDREKQTFRETVCLLIRHHMQPGHLLDKEDPERTLLTMAAEGFLCPDFTLERLCLLAEADALGRIAPDRADLLEKVDLFRQEAQRVQCLKGPGLFQDDYTQRAYFRGGQIWRGQRLYDDAWGEVTLLCGLPGTGKDTWIQTHGGGKPVVSLDALRVKMGVAPADNQGPVAQAAQAEARAWLRMRQPFIWNATNLTQSTRSRIVTLCEGYGASVRIVYLETSWIENLRRNRERRTAVPEHVIGEMLGRLVPPGPWEARRVEWHCV